jgi:hypothetical protein
LGRYEPVNGLQMERIPSFVRRGGRDINKDAAKPPLMERTGWSLTRKAFLQGGLVSNHPVCAAREASRHFFTGAATPPYEGGDYGLSDHLQFIHTFYAGAISLGQDCLTRRGMPLT